MNNKNIWILGAGRFGKLAVERLKRSGRNTTITIVDHAPEKLHLDGVRTVCEDGVQWLCKNLSSEIRNADIIIPSIPVHVAAEWLKLKLKEKGKNFSPTTLPDTFYNALPNPIRIGPDQILASFADFICPASCEEPDDYCPHTGEKRVTPLFQLLETSCPVDFCPIILQSHQLFPGIGGIYPEDLWQLYEDACGTEQKQLIVGTACRCHGVINGINII